MQEHAIRKDNNRRTNNKCIDCGADITDKSMRCVHCASADRMAYLFPPVYKECKKCGKKFRVIKSRLSVSAFCSPECRYSYYIRTCPMCGKQYKPPPDNTKIVYCSKKCFIEHYKTNPYPRPDRRIDLICEYCGVTFKRLPSRSKKKHQFCSCDCFHLYNKGSNNGFYNSVDCECEICGTKFKREKSKVDKYGGKYCSRSCFSQSQVSNGTNYRGPNWKEQRRKARHRDGYICRACGKTEIENLVNLSVHHIIPFNEFGIKKYKEANRLSNLISLCRVCHRKVEKGKLTYDL